MSPVKNKEDTWKANELEKHIRTMRDDKGSPSKSRRHDDDKDRQERRHRDDSVKKHRDEDDRRNRDDKERRHRDERERRPPDDSDRKHRDDEKRHRDDRERRPQGDSDRKHRDDRERKPQDDRRRDDERRHRDEDREKPKASKTKESRDLEKTSSSKLRDEDDDERRRRREERKRREAEEAGDGERDHRRHRERDNRDTDGKRHRDRDTDGEKRRDRDKDEKREKHRTKQEELESKPRRKDEKERSKEDDAEGRHRRHKDDRDRGDSESRHQRQRDRYKEEEERGRDERERDKDRESRKHRREKETAAGEDVDRDRRRAKSEKTEKEERKKKQPEPEKVKNYDEYEDDFEAYADDFDAGASDNSDASDHYQQKKTKVTRKPKPADENSASGSGRSAEGGKEMDDILRAIDDENKRLLSSSPVHQKEDERRQSKKKVSLPQTDRPTFINFVSAKQRTVTGKTSKKIRTRANDLLNLIEFDTVSFTLFEQHSEKEYDRFIRSFGRMNAMQAYVQTNEDNLDQEIQTEEIGLRDKWSQHPPEAGIPPCGGDCDPSSSVAFGQLVYKVPWDTALEKGIRVIETLLEENNMEYMHKNVGHKQSNIVVSEAFVELSPVSILEGRHVISSQFSPDQNHLLLAAYSRGDKNSEESNPLQAKGIVCIWNVYEPTRPQKILLCPSQPLCGCFSPVKSTLVFAGLEDGVIVMWDLREPDGLHKRLTYDNVEHVLRLPTYSTAMPYLHDSHNSPVIRLAPIVSNASKSNVSGSTTAEECLSFQLASLEQNSVIVLWVVVELDRPDPVGSMSDFGLREGGRVKLSKSSMIKLKSPRSARNLVLDTTFESTDLQVWPKDNSQYIVATTATGCVLHASRHGGHISPKAFRPKSDYPFDVTSIDFSPFLSSIFLAGGSDGSIRLFRVDLSHALMTWRDATDGRSIRMVRWCRSRPSVFFVLDEDSFIYIWDLHMDDSCALKKERIAKSSVTSICLSNDHKATGQGLPDRPPQMAVFLETGVAEAHIIKKEFSALMPDEVRQFSKFINKAIL